MSLHRSTLRFGVLLAAATALSGVASAAGTNAGTTVSNTFTLDYAVGGSSQPQINNTASPTNFTVDRKVDLTVTALDAAQTVAPNSTDRTIRYRVTNLSNDSMAYSLVNSTAGSTYTPTNISISYFIDTNGDGIMNGAETLQSYTAGTATVDVPADQSIVVIVESDVPAGTADGAVGTFTLTADSLYPVTSVDAGCTPALCPAGTAIVGDSNGNSLTGASESVLADGAGSTDAANQGDHSVAATLTVLAPTLTAVKSVVVFRTLGGTDASCAALNAPASGDQYPTPGACVQYVIALNNTGGGVARALDIRDRLPAQVRYVAASLTTSSGTGFVDDPLIAGAGPTLTTPAAAENCDGTTNCFVNLTNAQLAGAQNGQIRIWAIVR